VVVVVVMVVQKFLLDWNLLLLGPNRHLVV
jgi:hypothetical protein